MTPELAVARPEHICPHCGALGLLIRYLPLRWSGDTSQPHQAEYRCPLCKLYWTARKGYR